MNEANEFPSISIVIPTLNSERTIEKCLSSIASQNYPKEKVETIIVDGGSSDSTIRKSKSFRIRESCGLYLRKQYG